VNLARLTVPRPVLTIMAMLIVVTVGAISLSRLPIDLMPELTYPTLTVLTNYTNASPEEVEDLITRPVEGAVAAVPGVETITSVSTEGASTVRVSFTWGTDLDVGANDIRDRLDRIVNQLPDEAERPRLFKFDAASFPVLILAVSSGLDPIELRQLIDDHMKYRLERIPGVAAVDVFGGLQREIQVRLDPERVRALQLPLDRVLAAITDANVSLPAGEIQHGLHEVTLRTPGQFRNLDELRNTVVAVRDGAPILLRQIADVRDTNAKVTRIERVNGKPGVRLGVRKQSTANTVEVARTAMREVERLNRDFPQVEIVPLIDSSQYILRSIGNIGQTILYGGLLAALVLLFFLRDLRSTLVVTTAIPISLIATFTLIYFGGFTLNIMTLGGLSLGVGMMVDNAIVVLENIVRRRERGGEGATHSAISGTGQVALAIFASTLTTLAVFLPLFFFRGITGVLFKQMAYVVSFALGCSFLMALSVVPMLAARLARRPGDPGAAHTALGRRVLGGAERAFERLEGFYGRLLGGALRHRPALLLGVGVLLAGLLALVPRIGTEFMPSTDESEVRVTVEMEPGTRMDVLERQMLHVERLVAEAIPERHAYFLRTGGSFTRAAPATGEIRVYLLPASQRQRSSAQIAIDLRRRLRGIAGAVVRARAGSGLFVLRLGSSADEQVQIEVRGFDLHTLDRIAADVRDAIADVPGITDVRLSREAGVPQQLIHVDRRRAADLGVSVSNVARMLETAIAGSTAGTFRTGGQEPDIRVQLRDAERLSLDDVLDLTVSNVRGEAVVLRNLVRTEPERGPIQIDRINQQRASTVAANIAGRDLGSVIADVRERLGRVVLPRNYEVAITGDYEEQQKAFRELVFGFVLALALVYMIMASLYESLRDPLVVMCTVPLGSIGVIGTLWLTGTTFNVQSFIGSIMLVGIVVNNAILIVDRTNQLRAEGALSPRAAVQAAGRERMRPILMTSLTTICALLPLAIGLGEGAEAQAPMARAVVGGLTSSTFVTLIVIPVVYTLFHPEPRSAEQTRPQPEADGRAAPGADAQLPLAGK
jgi:HAE1 family hydrophobic/amphiphilic exporter-1